MINDIKGNRSITNANATPESVREALIKSLPPEPKSLRPRQSWVVRMDGKAIALGVKGKKVWSQKNHASSAITSHLNQALPNLSSDKLKEMKDQMIALGMIEIVNIAL